jgi:hypothetical protein
MRAGLAYRVGRIFSCAYAHNVVNRQNLFSLKSLNQLLTLTTRMNPKTFRFFRVFVGNAKG